jgi:hypothetical protein
MASWALILRVDGADVKIPLKAMNVLLFKDEEHAKQNPSVFQIEGSGVLLIGEIAAADNVDYGEHWERLVNQGADDQSIRRVSPRFRRLKDCPPGHA